jgi:hypothetical protein
MIHVNEIKEHIYDMSKGNGCYTFNQIINMTNCKMFFSPHILKEFLKFAFFLKRHEKLARFKCLNNAAWG